MQTKKVVKQKPKQLDQGHIFDLASATFPAYRLSADRKPVLGEDGKPIIENKTFFDFYPYAEFSEVQYGIVINQSCDLENRKAPYLTVGVLEPVESDVNALLDKGFFVENFKDFEGAQIYHGETLIESLSKELDDLIQNKTEGASYLFFLELDRKKRRFFFVNLTKLFPIRGDHYDSVLKKVKYTVIGNFQHLIGWKLANLYGRVGVKNYTPEQKSKIIAELAPKVITAITKSSDKNFIDVKEKKNFSIIRSNLDTLKTTKSEDTKTRAMKQIIGILETLKTPPAGS